MKTRAIERPNDGEETQSPQNEWPKNKPKRERPSVGGATMTDAIGIP